MFSDASLGSPLSYSTLSSPPRGKKKISKPNKPLDPNNFFNQDIQTAARSTSKNYKGLISRCTGRLILKHKDISGSPFSRIYEDNFPQNHLWKEFAEYIQKTFVGKAKKNGSSSGSGDCSKISTTKQITKNVHDQTGDKDFPNLPFFKRVTREFLHIFLNSKVFKRILKDETEMKSHPYIKVQLFKNLETISTVFLSPNPPRRLKNFEFPDEDEVKKFYSDQSDSDKPDDEISNLDSKFNSSCEISHGNSESTQVTSDNFQESPVSQCECFEEKLLKKKSKKSSKKKAKPKIKSTGWKKKSLEDQPQAIDSREQLFFEDSPVNKPDIGDIYTEDWNLEPLITLNSNILERKKTEGENIFGRFLNYDDSCVKIPLELEINLWREEGFHFRYDFEKSLEFLQN